MTKKLGFAAQSNAPRSSQSQEQTAEKLKQWQMAADREGPAIAGFLGSAFKTLLSPGDILADALGLTEDSNSRLALNLLTPTPGDLGPMHALGASLLPLAAYRMDRAAAKDLGTQAAKDIAEKRIAEDIAAARHNARIVRRADREARDDYDLEYTSHMTPESKKAYERDVEAFEKDYDVGKAAENEAPDYGDYYTERAVPTIDRETWLGGLKPNAYTAKVRAESKDPARDLVKLEAGEPNYGIQRIKRDEATNEAITPRDFVYDLRRPEYYAAAKLGYKGEEPFDYVRSIDRVDKGGVGPMADIEELLTPKERVFPTTEEKWQMLQKFLDGPDVSVLDWLNKSSEERFAEGGVPDLLKTRELANQRGIFQDLGRGLYKAPNKADLTPEQEAGVLRWLQGLVK